jgi:chromosome segregation ATPase
MIFTDLVWLFFGFWAVLFLSAVVFGLVKLRQQKKVNDKLMAFMRDWRISKDADRIWRRTVMVNAEELSSAKENIARLHTSLKAIEDATNIRIAKLDEAETRLIKLEAFVEEVRERAKALRESRDELYTNIKARMAR